MPRTARVPNWHVVVEVESSIRPCYRRDVDVRAPAAASPLHMNHAPMRTLLSGLLGLFCMVSVATAGTDGTATAPLSDGTTLSFNHLYLHENNTKANTQPIHDPDSVYKYFNYAHCQCSIPGVAQKSPYYENVFSYLILLSSASSTIHQPLEIWTGTGCDDTVMRPMNCHQISSAGVTDIAAISTVGVAPDVPIWELMNPEPRATGVAPACMHRILSANAWAIADTMGAGTPNFFLAQSIATDSLPPPLPTQFNANGAENAISISWTAPASNQTSIYAYQALCAKASDGTPALASRSNDPRYSTARNLCGATIDGADVALTTSVPDEETRVGSLVRFPDLDCRASVQIAGVLHIGARVFLGLKFPFVATVGNP